MYHSESDSLFEIDEGKKLELYQSYDGGLCNDVTGDPAYESRWASEKI